ncbi:FliM/FliN family flagellar motor C-terminal domain-containing protein [Ruegeria sp. THAF33]|uniref:FliM/FliN family flagellar motor C-terminal domain-containing protein n=1 Tax=Ruegeria sp. THAF33 TaxID=2587853 RepID=UPI001267E1CA|nr:FliM/FliN family flagellar motor C-terminal domain-containing protein [Ruegeria sp. THAF33]QFT72224.1 Surface presentation of antigens (SPOA) [Ruegeria sp. THAF33]
MSQTVSAALARKLSVGRKDLGDRPRSVLRALRLGFARAASDRLNLPLAVIGAKQASRTQDDMVESVAQDWLMLVFDGPEARAGICLSPHVVSAIVQTQTIGEVLPGDPDPRAFTDTDAAMVVPFIETALTLTAGSIDAAAEQVCLTGYEFAARTKDSRGLSLAMTEDEYRVFDLTVDLAGGAQQGQISIFLPEHPATPEKAEEVTDPAGPRLEQASGVVRAELNAVLCRMSLPLSDLSEIQPGCVLPLRGARLDRTEILTIDRKPAGIGRLGQCGGLRAVRLNEHSTPPALSGDDAQEFIESRGRMQPHDDLVEPVSGAVDVMPPAIEDAGLDLTDNDLSLNDSERMVAEISQLAGLDAADTNPGAE